MLSGALAIACAEDYDGTAPAAGEVESPAALADERQRCASHQPGRRAFFGDLHVHTSLSLDAFMFDVRVMPEDAYRYAFGDAIRLPPNDDAGQGTRVVRIDRPLDFAAVTDHAEFLGERILCVDPESAGYDSALCESIREGEGRNPRLVMRIMSPIPWRDGEVCGRDDALCRDAAAGAWRQTQRAAAEWNDESPRCERTTFIAYEYSSHRLGSHLHRNVIFRNDIVPASPVSYIEASREWELWDSLELDCLDAGTGCDAIAIPHNSNISNGRMFAVDYPGAWSIESQRARAAQRARLERVVEIMQHKGDSECRNGLEGVLGGEDELCNFEKFENLAFETTTGDNDVGTCYRGPFADFLPHLGPDCLSPLSYVRYALVEGLKEEARLGVNPFKLGLSASTDTHNGMAGGVAERSYAGHLGIGDDTPLDRVSWSREIAGNTSNNPGGLIAVWAEENSRESIFAALHRREVFGTSGPRMRVRFFGGWDFAPELCDDPEMVRRAYDEGVPMGSDLPEPGSATSPSFLSVALRDAGTRDAPGTALQRIQIVKGWADDDGEIHQRVYDVAGSDGGGAGVAVDPATCTPSGPGHAALCSVWRDPDFDPATRAVYYARAVENPSCRYSAWQCLEIPEAERPDDCDGGHVPKLIQERAWTSPIWYAPR